MIELNLNNRSVLFKVAKKVQQNDSSIAELILTMQKIVSETKGFGLAAPQIGVSKRVIIINTPGVHQVIINPVITKRKLGKTNSIERCLSFPGFEKKVKRYRLVVVEGFTQLWIPVKFKLIGLDSFCAQHEVDHLNGINLKDTD